MIQILTIIGARPQIIKAAAISRAIHNHFSESITEHLLHTGQHYDENMSEVFFQELGIPRPTYQLNVGSGSHGAQTALMIQGIEDILQRNHYDAVLVYGDTNSTLAGAIAAVKIHVPVVHVEAGLRSFNKAMPEEINRILCDHSSTLLFSPTKQGIENLYKENIVHHEKPWSADRPAVFHCGDIMYDNSLHFAKEAANRSQILEKVGVQLGQFFLCTIHRNTNTDDPKLLTEILVGLDAISEAASTDIVLPLHPRTKGKLTPEMLKLISKHNRIRIIEPLSFIDMIAMESACSMVVTDSGGVQKEAFFFKKPCIILREQTEWVELVENGNALLTGANSKKMIDAYHALKSRENEMTWPDFFGNGQAAQFICSILLESF